MNAAFDYRRLSLVSAPCVLCGGFDFEPLARCDRNDLGLETVGCRNCGLVQTHPRPSEADLAHFYRDSYRQLYQAVENPDSKYVAQFGKAERLRYTADVLAGSMDFGEGASLLDCGCGEGSLFAALRERGFEGRLYGIEPNPQFADYARHAGQATVYLSIEEAIASGLHVDGVVLVHVLEHFANPQTTLTTLRGMLSPGGRLYVDVPDVEQYRSVDDLHIAHLLHFDRRTLRAVLARAGFAVDWIEAHQPPYHPPSIRAIARAGNVGTGSLPAPDLAIAGWKAVSMIQRRAWQRTLRRYVARIPGVRRLWRAMNAMARPSSAPGESRR